MPKAIALRPWWVLAIIFFAALGLRLKYVAEELRQSSLDQIVTFNWDSREYIHLAHNLASSGRYIDDAAPKPEDRRISHFFALLRTPGYPLFLAFFLKFPGSLSAALWAQALLGALIPLAVLRLSDALFDSRLIGPIAAAFSAVSPTGMGLSGIFLVDGLFALCVILSWLLLWTGVARGRLRWYALSGLFAAVGVLFKPTLLYWPLAMAPLAWLMGKSLICRARWLGVAIAAAMPLAAAGAWCTYNARAQGSFVYCIVDAQNLRHFLAPLVEVRSRLGWSVSSDDIWKAHFAARYRDWDDMTSGALTAAELGRRQRAQSLQILKAHPLLAVSTLVVCGVSSVGGGWSYTRDELTHPSIVKFIADNLDRFWYGFWKCGLGALLVIWGLAQPLLQDGGLKNPLNRRRFFAGAALAWTALYFLLAAGTSFSTGFRLLYPAEFTLLLLVVSGAAAFCRTLRRRFSQGHRI